MSGLGSSIRPVQQSGIAPAGGVGTVSGLGERPIGEMIGETNRFREMMDKINGVERGQEEEMKEEIEDLDLDEVAEEELFDILDDYVDDITKGQPNPVPITIQKAGDVMANLYDDFIRANGRNPTKSEAEQLGGQAINNMIQNRIVGWQDIQDVFKERKGFVFGTTFADKKLNKFFARGASDFIRSEAFNQYKTQLPGYVAKMSYADAQLRLNEIINDDTFELGTDVSKALVKLGTATLEQYRRGEFQSAESDGQVLQYLWLKKLFPGDDDFELKDAVTGYQKGEVLPEEFKQVIDGGLGLALLAWKGILDPKAVSKKLKGSAVVNLVELFTGLVDKINKGDIGDLNKTEIEIIKKGLENPLGAIAELGKDFFKKVGETASIFDVKSDPMNVFNLGVDAVMNWSFALGGAITGDKKFGRFFVYREFLRQFKDAFGNGNELAKAYEGVPYSTLSDFLPYMFAEAKGGEFIRESIASVLGQVISAVIGEKGVSALNSSTEFFNSIKQKLKAAKALGINSDFLKSLEPFVDIMASDPVHYGAMFLTNTLYEQTIGRMLEEGVIDAGEDVLKITKGNKELAEQLDLYNKLQALIENIQDPSIRTYYNTMLRRQYGL